MKRRTVVATLVAGAIALTACPAIAQDVTLRLHQFLPPQAPLPAHVLKPWAESVEAASDGRIKIQHFDAMALGGTPPSLMDQARDGVVDIVMTLVGYTPGRFPRTEVFELPFMMTSPIATSQAFWEMVDTDWQDSEYKDVKILGAWVHGPGVIHSREGVESLEDMKGLKLRGPTRMTNELLGELGATPVGMPLPAIPEALSTGVIDATVIPWEVTASIRLSELVDNHTEFGGDRALYTAALVLAMNQRSYDKLPDDLKAILDAESGAKLSQMAAQVMWDYDAPGRKIAQDAGNTIVVLDEAEVARWQQAALPVVDRWVADMDSKGIDGTALIDQAQGLIDKYETE
ncbi:MAG: C4-dicarboxylate ABC transporter [Rhodobacteraceae bacterium]|nr:C4-dicarboxylate ABC transporter [Paracoccaceae bacterium]QEW22044.1 Neu5Ac-binding protein [Marinibacterium anthonyi]